MRIGDLVRSMGPVQGSPLLCGIIVSQHWITGDRVHQCFEVMLQDGTVRTFASTALTKLETTSENR